eukprot:243605-Chlamydomonas_euryale.AAC.1
MGGKGWELCFPCLGGGKKEGDPVGWRRRFDRTAKGRACMCMVSTQEVASLTPRCCCSPSSHLPTPPRPGVHQGRRHCRRQADARAAGRCGDADVGMHARAHAGVEGGGQRAEGGGRDKWLCGVFGGGRLAATWHGCREWRCGRQAGGEEVKPAQCEVNLSTPWQQAGHTISV